MISIKKLVENLNPKIGRVAARVPFQFRLGSTYRLFQNELLKGEPDEVYAVRNFSRIFELAKELPFYRELYRDTQVRDLKISTLEDITKVPIVTKEMIRANVDRFHGAMKLNTGGTSGEPFRFYVDKQAFAREWAHMHFLWQKKGYNYRDYKLTLRGRNLGKKKYQYNAIHNEFIVNSYLPACEYANEILELVKTFKIRYIHGYPSTIHKFLKELEAELGAEELASMRKHLSCCLLGSEFPPPPFTKYLAEVWKLDFLSWYGHSEMCILAYDIEKENRYVPLHTYGLAEVCEDRLIGTSFHNADMPLIRYDTGDRVSGETKSSGLLSSFKVTGGRDGEVVLDRNGFEISLTALIFGRHHQLFDFVKSLQVKQSHPGEVEILITTDKQISSHHALELMELSSVDINFSLKIVEKPYLTQSGKLPLLVRHR